MFAQRMSRARAAMEAKGIDALLLSVGPDLPYLTGYEAMPLERLTMLVVPGGGEATLVVPALEAPRVVERPEVFRIHTWGETEDPLDIVAGLVGGSRAGTRRSTAAVGDHTWSRFVLGLIRRLPGAAFVDASTVTGPLRAVKAPDEVEALRRAAAAADRVAAQLQGGQIPLVGRTEAEVSADIGRRLLAEGHHRVNFAIVAAGANAASPHHEPGSRVIAPGEVVLCDFGGTMLTGDGTGYCSDITRCVHTGVIPDDVAEAYAVLHEAQAAAVATATVGTPCAQVDAAARDIIAAAGFGDRFIHRTGHGIGVEAHEDPYIVEGNDAALVAGHAFSVEPGIYLPGRWGLRLEDIVVAAPDGPDALNRADHGLVVVDA
jgi:Xaa-Pro aminopeptidase